MAPRVAAGVAVVMLVSAGLYGVWRREPPREPPATLESHEKVPAPDPEVPTRLALATASLEAHDYRAALAYAGQVLTLDPNHAGAIKIRDEARAMLARFDAALADARRRLAAGDLAGATQALATARGIDASAPGVIDLGSRLAERARQRESTAEAARRASPPAEPLRETRAARSAADQVATPEPPAPRTDGPAPAPGPSSTQETAAATPPPPAPEPVPAVKPTPTPVERAVEPRERQTPPAAPSAEEDEAAIRRVTATYARAIETKNVELFRSIKPDLSREEERRLLDGFRAVTSQEVDLTILSIQRRGDEASVVLRRRDTIEAGGRRQAAESQQTMRLARTAAGWKIVDIR
jgi:hypothetical protein